MTDSEEAALLTAVFAAPDDDLPRLVYADWLDEHDRPGRAALIRAQVGGRAGPYPYTDPALPRPDFGLDGVNRRGAACCTHAESHGIDAGVKRASLLFRRGFCEAARCPAGWWWENGDALLARHPVRAVRLTTPPEGDRLDLAAGRARFRVAGKVVAVPAGGGPLTLVQARWPAVREWDLPGEAEW